VVSHKVILVLIQPCKLGFPGLDADHVRLLPWLVQLSHASAHWVKVALTMLQVSSLMALVVQVQLGVQLLVVDWSARHMAGSRLIRRLSW
jgi:hypothetical protein